MEYGRSRGGWEVRNWLRVFWAWIGEICERLAKQIVRAKSKSPGAFLGRCLYQYSLNPNTLPSTAFGGSDSLRHYDAFTQSISFIDRS